MVRYFLHSNTLTDSSSRKYKNTLHLTSNFRFICHSLIFINWNGYKNSTHQIKLPKSPLPQKSPRNQTQTHTLLLFLHFHSLTILSSEDHCREMDEETTVSSATKKTNKTHGNIATRWAIFKRSLRRESRKMKLLGSAFKWMRLRRTNLPISFLDDLLFKIVSILEAVVLVVSLCFFFLCFGCHFWNFDFSLLISLFALCNSLSRFFCLCFFF